MYTDTHSLGLEDKVVGMVPVGQQVCGLLIIHTYVVVAECPREEVVYLPGHVEDVAHSGERVSPILSITLQMIVCVFILGQSRSHPVSCSSSKLDAFHSEPWATTNTSSTLLLILYHPSLQ